MEVATIYVDTSWKKGKCCAGYILIIGNRLVKESSAVFEADNNNDAEIKGIQIASEAAVDILNKKGKLIDSFFFIVYCDSAIATAMCDSNYIASKKALDKFQCVKEVREWCLMNNVTLKCQRMERTNPIIKTCDKLSKRFRRRVKWNKK